MGQALWFTSRGTGLVSLLLLTTTVVIGAIHSGRASTGEWPRFALHAVHRNLAMLTVAFVTVHVSTAIIDPYAGITWLDAVLPFGASYHPFWLGLGTVALDLLAAVIITSFLRARIGLRPWRIVHLATYLLWPVALLHGYGIGGPDSELGWVLVIEAGCAVAVIGAVAWRLLAHDPDRDARRAAESVHR